MCRMNGSLPNRLQFGKHFFAQVTALTPALSELVQLTCHTFPIGAIAMRCRPDFDFFNQSQALRFVRRSLCAGFFEPGIHHVVGAIARSVKALPQSGIGRSFFVNFFPLLSQGTQGFLHLATAHRRNACRHILSFSGWFFSISRLICSFRCWQC